RQSYALGNGMTFKTSIPPAEDNALKATIAGNKHQVIAYIRAVIDVRLRVQQVDAGDIALPTTRCHHSAGAANSQEFAAEAAFVHPAQEIVEADTVATDDHEIRRLQAAA